MIIRAIEDDRNASDSLPMDTERSRFVCLFCTGEVHALVICDGPVCHRCRRIATIQRALTADETVPVEKTPDEQQFTKILAGAHAKGLFKLPRKREEHNG